MLAALAEAAVAVAAVALETMALEGAVLAASGSVAWVEEWVWT